MSTKVGLTVIGPDEIGVEGLAGCPGGGKGRVFEGGGCERVYVNDVFGMLTSGPVGGG